MKIRKVFRAVIIIPLLKILVSLGVLALMVTKADASTNLACYANYKVNRGQLAPKECEFTAVIDEPHKTAHAYWADKEDVAKMEDANFVEFDFGNQNTAALWQLKSSDDKSSWGGFIVPTTRLRADEPFVCHVICTAS